ncbi:hypothetical protein M1437_02475 [Patescibacteria group bacterium]|nr:hypothetical protein [Patescibacteria group bacterium]
MAVIGAERLTTSNNIDSLTQKVRGLVGFGQNKTAQVTPWESRWQEFPQSVIYGVTGCYFKYRNALEFFIANKNTEAAIVWYKHARKDFLDIVHQDPQNHRFYKSLRQSDYFTTGPKETLGEKCQRLLIKGRDRLLKVL